MASVDDAVRTAYLDKQREIGNKVFDIIKLPATANASAILAVGAASAILQSASLGLHTAKAVIITFLIGIILSSASMASYFIYYVSFEMMDFRRKRNNLYEKEYFKAYEPETEEGVWEKALAVAVLLGVASLVAFLVGIVITLGMVIWHL